MNELPLPQPLDREEWRGIEGHYSYEVSSLGRVRSYHQVGRGPKLPEPQRVLTPSPDRQGYMQIRLSIKPGAHITRKVHRLAALAFIGRPPEGREHVRHLDGNPGNNSINNLCWSSPKENHADKVRHGTAQRGSKCAKAKLSDAMVLEAVRRLSRGEFQESVGRSLGVAQNTISRIARGEAWSHLTGIPKRQPGNPRTRRAISR